MEKQEIIKVIEKSVNELDALRVKLLNEDLPYTKKKKTSKKEIVKDELEQETLTIIKNALVLNNLPNDNDFIEDIYKVCYRNNIYKDTLEEVLKAVRKADDKSPKNDIKKYIFTCLYNVNKK